MPYNNFPLFELLQVAVGNRRQLSRMLSADEWAALRLEFKRQALLGIGYVGITKLPKEQCPPIEVLAQWVHNAEKIRRRNAAASDACRGVCRLLEQDGFNCCILKGQSNIRNYVVRRFCDDNQNENIGEFRTSGDIDVLCWPKVDYCAGTEHGPYRGKRAVIEYVLGHYRRNHLPLPEVNYHHVDWHYDDIPVEVHFRASWLNNPVANRRLQRWCDAWCSRYFSSGADDCGDVSGFPVPPLGFDAVYQLVHVYRHLFNEGIGLRQLLDYYFVLRSFSSNEDVMRTLEHIGVDKFAGAVMYVLQKVFAMSSEYLLCTPDAKRGEFLLNEIMLAGNFGKYDERNLIAVDEGYLKRFVRRQKRFLRFLSQYPSEVIWGPYFSVKQRMWRMWHGWR